MFLVFEVYSLSPCRSGSKASYCHGFLYFCIAGIFNLIFQLISLLLPNFSLCFRSCRMGRISLYRQPPVSVMHYGHFCSLSSMYPCPPRPSTHQILTFSALAVYLQFYHFSPFTLVPALSEQTTRFTDEFFFFTL